MGTRVPVAVAATAVVIAFAALTTAPRHGAAVHVIQIVLGLVVMFAPILESLIRRNRKPLRVYERMVRNPLFYCWFGLIALLSIQWVNAGRELVFSASEGVWEYAPPRWPVLPSAFAGQDAIDVLSWFIPAGAIGSVLSSGKQPRKGVLRALKWIALPAGLLGWCGFVQWIIADSVGMPRPSEGFFVSGFGYANHAGAFFVLMLGPALGLLADAFRPNTRVPLEADQSLLDIWRKERMHTASQQRMILVRLIVVLGCLVGAHVSMSRAAICMSWLMVIGSAVFMLRMSWGALTPAKRIRVTVWTLAMLCMAFFFVHGSMHTELDSELATLKGQEQGEALQQVITTGLFGNRTILRQASVDIWRDAPLMGSGVWSLRYLAPLKMNMDLQMRPGSGTANAHCDPLQFLSEFGLIGFGLLTGMMAWVIVMARRGYRRGSALGFCSMFGLSIVLLYSLIDLPFRHPAILCAWFAIAALLGSRNLRKKEGQAYA